MPSSQMLLDRRRFLRLAASAGASAALGGCARAVRGLTASGAREPSLPPNFIVIFTDDQGYQDLGCFGSPDIRTPNLDRMASEGVRFTDFYVSAPVCSPSRAALLTGRYHPRTGVNEVLHPPSTTGLPPEEITLAEMLKTRGYATACIGKWHLGHLPQFLPTRRGFNEYFGLPYSNDMTGGRKQKTPGVPLMRGEKIIEKPVNQDTLTQRYTEEAIDFIKRNRKRPFFLYLPHTFPHTPLHVSKAFAGRSKRGLYGDVVEEIDWSVGEILKTLKSQGLDDNTLVIFTSDNGPWLAMGRNGGSAAPLRDGKFTAYEGGMREPAIMRWPGRIPTGQVCKEIAATIDILPTLARLSGAQAPVDRPIDGRDIWPLMAQPGAKTPHEAYFYHVGANIAAVRSGKWKLMLPQKAVDRKGKKPFKNVETPAALYDLEADIGETRDVAKNHPAEVKRLLGLIEQFRKDFDAGRTGPFSTP